MHSEEQSAFSGLAESIMSFPFTASVVVVIIIKCNKLQRRSCAGVCNIRSEVESGAELHQTKKNI